MLPTINIYIVVFKQEEATQQISDEFTIVTDNAGVREYNFINNLHRNQTT